MAQRLPLQMTTEFLDWLDEEAGTEGRQRYISAAAAMRERVVFTGRLEHDEVADVSRHAEAMVVQGTFPESFGMVAAEAAACGALFDQRRPLGAVQGVAGA